MNSSLTVRELLETASLGLELLAGEQGLGDRISWAHISELEDPAAWMDGGELLITNGIGVPDDAEGQRTFLRRLHARKVVALAIGLRCELLPETLALADELRFPVLRVPVRTSFVPIMRLVLAANQDAAQRKLLVSLRIFDTLAPRVEPLTPRARFRMIEEISGYRLFLVTPWGESLLEGFEPAPAEVAAALPEIVADERSHPTVPGGTAAVLRVGPRVAGVLVALERSGAMPGGHEVVRNIVTIAGLELRELYREREVRRRKGAELLGKLLAGDIEEDSDVEHLTAAGLPPGAAFVLAAVEAPEPYEQLDDELNNQLADRGCSPLLLAEGGRVFLLLAERDLPVLEAVVGDLGLWAGASAVHTNLRLSPVARREAGWALMQARRRRGERHAVVPFASDVGPDHWLPADIPALGRMIERILGPVQAYDAEHGTELVQSLRVYFEFDRRLKDAATQLFVHKHTLSYRLRRIESLTGRDLRRIDDQSELWLALKAMDVVAASPPAPNGAAPARGRV
ncbi:MAG: PucR family transcriptional regulator [Solirubrobacterales bacterium]|nr:PucR family transcriptional regulator [Solirubrobacterales bacterium]